MISLFPVPAIVDVGPGQQRLEAVVLSDAWADNHQGTFLVLAVSGRLRRGAHGGCGTTSVLSSRCRGPVIRGPRRRLDVHVRG